MPKKIQDSVIVITGASSGIGRAAALAFAGMGGTLVLAARREQPLHDLAEACRQLGGQALAIPTDVTNEGAVQHLARQAIEHFGRIDVWINNAAVSMFARFEEAPMAEYRRVIETNLFGYIYGARAALPYFREQGGGILINNSSVFGTMGGPYLSAYIATKFAIRGLSECLRQELRDAPNIHVCTLLPASIDTPIFHHAANYTGRAIKPMNPIYPAEQVAQAMVKLTQTPQRELIVGNAGRMQKLMRTLKPGVAEGMLAEQIERDHFRDEPAAPYAGNLFAPLPQWTTVSGGWRAPQIGGMPAGALAGLALLVPAALAWLWLRNDDRLPFGNGRRSSSPLRFIKPALQAVGLAQPERAWWQVPLDMVLRR